MPIPILNRILLHDATTFTYRRPSMLRLELLSQELGKCFWWGKARTQSPTHKNDDVELPTFGAIVGVSPTEVQWKGLALGERPYWSSLLPAQVSMPLGGFCWLHITKIFTSFQALWVFASSEYWLHIEFSINGYSFWWKLEETRLSGRLISTNL